MQLLANPGSFRYAGWDLETRDQPIIVAGDYLEVKNGNRKIIQLYEDGTLIYKVPADNTFLGWGQNEENFTEKPRLNSLAVVEANTNFVHFYKKLIPYFEETPQSIQFKMQFYSMKIAENKFVYLNPTPVNALWPFDDGKYPAPSDEGSKEIVVETKEVEEKPSLVAYKILEKVFLWFGIPTDKIPYTREIEGQKYIDIEEFKKH
jgi:hypothetical protein